MDVSLVVDGRVCGHGHARGLIVDDRRYGLLRRRAAEATGVGETPAGPGPEPVADAGLVPPHRVGRQRRKDCVLERVATDAADRRWRLRSDQDHAILFDHPTDHIPLMVMLEGFRQLGHLTVHESAQGEPADGEFRAGGTGPRLCRLR